MRRVLLFILLSAAGLSTEAQVTTSTRVSPELRWKPSDEAFEIRIRHVDFVLPNKFNNPRTDLIVGKKLGKFKVWSMSKFTHQGQGWTGIRIDYNQFFLKKRLLTNWQYRYFIGVNHSSVAHHNFIQFFNYKLHQYFDIGALGFARFQSTDESIEQSKYHERYVANADEVLFWYAGPAVHLKFSPRFRIFASYDWNMVNTDQRLVFLRFNFNLWKLAKPAVSSSFDPLQSGKHLFAGSGR